MGERKVHVAFHRTHSSPCGQRGLPDDRIAKFVEDVTCYHCQRVYMPRLPSRHPAPRPAPGGPDE